MSAYKPIKSSNLEAAKYEDGTLFVKFKNGTEYSYQNISPELYKEFEETFSGENGKSAGKFFSAHIRHLPSEKVEE